MLVLVIVCIIDLIAVLRAITSVVKWHSLGLELPGLDKCQLDKIETDNRGIVDDCQKAMVSQWLHTGDVATWRGLVQALASPLVKRRDLAIEIAKQHQICEFPSNHVYIITAVCIASIELLLRIICINKINDYGPHALIL